MYDIIGDIHGHADELVQLLHKLGYEDRNDCFRHPSRQVVFCGDFVDRGPQIPEAVNIARQMVEGEAALAVMGNHEFNTLAFHTEVPGAPGTFLRPHNSKNAKQHKATCQQFGPEAMADALEWFATLPTSLELDGLRVVHACWSDEQRRVIAEALPPSGKMDVGFLQRATNPRDPVFHAVECTLKGPELALPAGTTVTDKEGNIRKRIRIRWFESPVGQTWATYSLPGKSNLAKDPVPHDAPAVPYPDDAPPVFVGHYWLPDSQPAPLQHNVACVDYSVAKHGMLCAYRFDGESELSQDNFVTVASRVEGVSA